MLQRNKQICTKVKPNPTTMCTTKGAAACCSEPSKSNPLQDCLLLRCPAIQGCTHNDQSGYSDMLLLMTKQQVSAPFILLTPFISHGDFGAHDHYLIGTISHVSCICTESSICYSAPAGAPLPPSLPLPAVPAGALITCCYRLTISWTKFDAQASKYNRETGSGLTDPPRHIAPAAGGL
eukprot:scaffold147188_cov19-Tisochrysis_lutea.AAC.2